MRVLDSFNKVQYQQHSTNGGKEIIFFWFLHFDTFDKYISVQTVQLATLIPLSNKRVEGVHRVTNGLP